MQLQSAGYENHFGAGYLAFGASTWCDERETGGVLGKESYAYDAGWRRYVGVEGGLEGEDGIA